MTSRFPAACLCHRVPCAILCTRDGPASTARVGYVFVWVALVLFGVFVMCLRSCESDAQRGNRVPAELCFMVLVSQVFGESQTGFKAQKKGRVFSRKAWMNGQVMGDDYCAASLFAVCKGGGDALRGQRFSESAWMSTTRTWRSSSTATRPKHTLSHKKGLTHLLPRNPRRERTM
jgi:hypothetical protein